VEERKLVSLLIFKVLAKKICVREALEKFPAGVKDSSLQCAWHALVHFEADEDLRKQDLDFAEEQNNYLEYIASVMEKGDVLPQNIIEEYNKFYEPVIKSLSNSFINKVKSVFRFIT